MASVQLVGCKVFSRARGDVLTSGSARPCLSLIRGNTSVAAAEVTERSVRPQNNVIGVIQWRVLQLGGGDYRTHAR